MIDTERVQAVPRRALVLVGLLLALGLMLRIAPLLQGERYMEHWPTEDGYFMLGMARNIAIGKGLSVADGTIATNGTQPLTTLVWAGAYGLVEGHPQRGVLLILVLELAISVASTLLLFRLGKRVFGAERRGVTLASIAAAVWFASPLVVPHSMNCLESGMYALLAIAIVLVFAERPEQPRLWSIPRCLAVGVLLGLAFWARNDAVFLIAAACLTYLYNGLPQGAVAVKARFGRTLVFGATSVVVASPWLIYNQVNFGSIMPVSGRAERLTGSFASTLEHLPAVLAEYATAVLAIPQALETRWYVLAACSAFVALYVVLALRLAFTLGRPASSAAVLVLGYGAGLCIFYGLFFGAAWFLPRYLFPLSPFLTLAALALVATFVERMSAKRPARSRALELVVGALVLAVCVGLGVREHLRRERHQHFQVVRWVEENVPDDVWVGAIQTGTLGYFHARTINLDGKVNPAAYEALLVGRIGEYVAEDTRIEYLADWRGMRDWLDDPAVADAFELLVDDPEQNLAVLRRKPREQAAPR